MNRLILLFVLLFSSGAVFAQTKQEKAVAEAVEAFRKALIDADSAQLDQLTDRRLSYGHSSGVVESKQAFMDKLLTGKSDFISIALEGQTIVVSGKTAIVRHGLNAVTNDNGKAGEVHLLVLLVWEKQRSGWKLLARQAVKKPA